MKIIIRLGLATGLLLNLPTIYAAQPAEGTFTLTQDCSAYHSIKKQTQPIDLKTGGRYSIIGQNKQNATHYLLKIDDQQRWIDLKCGDKSGDTLPNTTSSPKNDYLLALSWQPSFCQKHRTKKECKTQTTKRYDAKNLSLHGLWPQPKNNTYCNVSTKNKSVDRRGRWDLLEPLTLSADTWQGLREVMPAVVSQLERHEWIKHGTCYKDADPEVYYQDSIRLTKQVNEAVAPLFAGNIGRNLKLSTIQQAFEQQFGEGTGDKINLKCNRKGLITELWINVSGDIQKDTPLATLLKAAPNAKSACQKGEVDAVGY